MFLLEFVGPLAGDFCHARDGDGDGDGGGQVRTSICPIHHPIYMSLLFLFNDLLMIFLFMKIIEQSSKQ